MNIETLIYIKNMLQTEADHRERFLAAIRRWYYEEQEGIEASGSKEKNSHEAEYTTAREKYNAAKSALDDFLSVEWRA